MKKIIALILSLAMLLCAASVMAEGTQEKVTIGTVSINGVFTLQCGLPEGYTPVPLDVTSEHILAVVKSEDPNAPVMQLSIAFDEKYADVERLNDLSQEDLALLEETYIADDDVVDISYGETDYGTLLLIARHETDTLDFISFFSIYKGYCVEFVLVPSETAEDKNLTEDQLRVSVQFLTDLDFLPGTTRPADDPMAVAGGKWITNLSDYNAEDDTVAGLVMHTLPLPAEQAEALQVGDTLIVGQFQEEIEKLEVTDENTIAINDAVELRKFGDEYLLYTYEIEWLEPYMTLTLEIPDDLVIKDNIDKETGELLDEPVTYTVEEFKAMLAAESSPDFATDNTWVTFDENGKMVEVERVYSPAQ